METSLLLSIPQEKEFIFVEKKNESVELPVVVEGNTILPSSEEGNTHLYLKKENNNYDLPYTTNPLFPMMQITEPDVSTTLHYEESIKSAETAFSSSFEHHDTLPNDNSLFGMHVTLPGELSFTLYLLS